MDDRGETGGCEYRRDSGDRWRTPILKVRRERRGYRSPGKSPSFGEEGGDEEVVLRFLFLERCVVELVTSIRQFDKVNEARGFEGCKGGGIMGKKGGRQKTIRGERKAMDKEDVRAEKGELRWEEGR